MHSNLNISAVILGGGFGTRLKSVVSDRPKVLADVLGRPFITYLLDLLVESGISDVVLSTGYMAEKIREKIGQNYRSLRIIYSNEDMPLGTGGALKLASMKCSNGNILAMNGDSFIDVDLKDFITWFFEKAYKAAIIAAKVADYSRFGRVNVKENGLIIGFEEKSSKQEPGWINAGVYIFRKKILSSIPNGCFFSLEHEFFPHLVNKSLYAYPCEGDFLDIGTPESYSKVETFFKRIKNYDNLRMH